MNLPALREIGFSANRRLLRVQRLDHDPITGTQHLHQITDPVTTESGTRIPGLRLGQARSHALLSALLMFRTQFDGFTNRDLRTLTGQLRGLDPATLTTGQTTYDLRRLRSHGLIERVPHSHRYKVTDTGLHTAMLLTRIHERLLPTGLAEQIDPHGTAGSTPQPPTTSTPSTPSPNRTDSPPEQRLDSKFRLRRIVRPSKFRLHRISVPLANRQAVQRRPPPAGPTLDRCQFGTKVAATTTEPSSTPTSSTVSVS